MAYPGSFVQSKQNGEHIVRTQHAMHTQGTRHRGGGGGGGKSCQGDAVPGEQGKHIKYKDNT
eukprot:12773473-Heterocapsa_arctica.AAC.1